MTAVYVLNQTFAHEGSSTESVHTSLEAAKARAVEVVNEDCYGDEEGSPITQWTERGPCQWDNYARIWTAYWNDDPTHQQGFDIIQFEVDA